MKKRLLSVLLTLVVLLCCAEVSFSAQDAALIAAVDGTASYIYRTVSDPQIGSVGGEWAVLGLARSGYAVPDSYFQTYYETLSGYVQKKNGVLDERKYTEYSRVVFALSSIGKDPTDVDGYNLLLPLADFDKTVWQGINGPVWALIALDSREYTLPHNPNADTQATRQMYIDYILARQLADGGWSLAGKIGGPGPSDPDITGMALQALAKYQSQPAVKRATDEALACMSRQQNAQGGFTGGTVSTLESTVQMLVALGELGIPLDDARFVKNGFTILDDVLSYRKADGSFGHTDEDSRANQMSTEQGLYGLVSALRATKGSNSLYRMGDARKIASSAAQDTPTGLPGKHADVHAVPVTAPGTTFPDIRGHLSQTAIEALAATGIINGKSPERFDPDASMTRAEFATIVTRGLGLTPVHSGVFTDVTADAWYAGFIGTANAYGIVNGVGSGLFAPQGTMTVQEAVTMVARAATLCGMDTALSPSETTDTLDRLFSREIPIAPWAMDSYAFCLRSGILELTKDNLEPTRIIRRSEISQMLYNLLDAAELLAK
ncbi:MAG: S-layer homology domain-containing protein [Anaerovoracaceae bacterium]